MNARDIAFAVFQHEAQYRPGLRKATKQFRAECLAVLEGAARQAAAPYKGRRTGLIKGKRVPVSAIQESAARSVFLKYLTERNIRRREYGDSGEVSEDGTSVTASANVSMNSADRFNAEESRVFQRKKRGAPPGLGAGSRDMARDASVPWLDAPWSGQHFIARCCVLASSLTGVIVIPPMPWGRMRQIERQWRALRGETRGPLSLLDENLSELHTVPGTQVLAPRIQFHWGLIKAQTGLSLLDTVGESL